MKGPHSLTSIPTYRTVASRGKPRYRRLLHGAATAAALLGFKVSEMFRSNIPSVPGRPLLGPNVPGETLPPGPGAKFIPDRDGAAIYGRTSRRNIPFTLAVEECRRASRTGRSSGIRDPHSTPGKLGSRTAARNWHKLFGRAHDSARVFISRLMSKRPTTAFLDDGHRRRC